MKHSHKCFFIGLGLVCGLLLGYWLCGRGQTIYTTTTTTIDTMVVEKPIPYREEIIKKDTIPFYIYEPADTVFLHRVDSVLIEIPIEIEKREYKDSKYKAIISGAKIGDIRPTLDYIETYNVTTTTTMMVEPKKIRPYVGASVGVFGTWSVGIGGGLFIKDHHAVGAEYERVQTDNRFKVRYSYIF